MTPPTPKPATPLPWRVLPYKIGCRTPEIIEVDDAYELHACNAYPRLVSALQAVYPMLPRGDQSTLALLLKELGE